MKKFIIFLFIFILLVVGGVITYFLFEKPVKEGVNIVYGNVSVYAIDQETNQKGITGYIIKKGNNTYKNGITDNMGAVLEKLPFNQSITIFNNNTKEQEYYQDIHEFYLNESYKRVELKLRKPGEVIFNKINNTFLNIKSKGFVDKVKICFRYSGNIIYVKTNFTQIERIKDFDKCYDSGVTLNGTNSFNFPIDYKNFGNEEDYRILINVIDSNNNNYLYEELLS